MEEMDQERDLPIGERLRVAREAKGLGLDEVAGQTRIPVRHLQHIENGDWEALPAVTYSVGFVRAYGNAVGLDGPALGSELRQQLGATARRTGPAADYYEPADPARVPPRWLAVVAALIAVLLIGGYLLFRSGIDDPAEPQAAEQQAPAQQQASRPAPQAQQPRNVSGQPVVLAATAPVWLRVTDGGGRVIGERTMAAGETWQVPAGANRPVLRVGAPGSLRVTVGQTVIPPLGPAGQPVGNVSLAPNDLVARAQGGGASPQPGQPPAQ